jgi:hypothetical protein
VLVASDEVSEQGERCRIRRVRQVNQREVDAKRRE